MDVGMTIDTPAARLKQKVTVSYAEYRDLEKSWLAARALVRFLREQHCAAVPAQQQHVTCSAACLEALVSALLSSQR